MLLGIAVYDGLCVRRVNEDVANRTVPHVVWEGQGHARVEVFMADLVAYHGFDKLMGQEPQPSVIWELKS